MDTFVNGHICRYLTTVKSSGRPRMPMFHRREWSSRAVMVDNPMFNIGAGNRMKKPMVVCAGLAAMVAAGMTIAANVAPSRLASGPPESLGFSTDRLRKLDRAMQSEIDTG